MNKENTSWPDSLQVCESDTADGIAAMLAKDVAEDLQKAVAARGSASLLVSGGSTPLPFFKSLMGMALDWSRITVGLVDERWVPASHDDSNERFVREQLLTGAASAATFSGMYLSDESAEHSAELASIAMSNMLKAHDGAFDVVILGMGGDAHTASLFPVIPGTTDKQHEQVIVAALSADANNDTSPCVVIRPVTAPHARISLTLAAILESRSRYLHITGEQKRDVLLSALEHKELTQVPIAAVMRRAEPRIYWSP